LARFGATTANGFILQTEASAAPRSSETRSAIAVAAKAEIPVKIIR
jgi:hypothetical protein